MRLFRNIAPVIVFTAVCLAEAPPDAAAGQAPPASQTPATGQQSESLPSWLKVGAEVRGRAESNTGLRFSPGSDETYYLHRLRLNASIEPDRWVRFFVQAQDSQAPGYSQRPVPDNVVNTLDLRQGYVELGLAEKGSWTLRVGRQELIFGEERLVGASNWGNVGRTFDAARFTYRRTGARLDWFASSVATPINGQFDRPRLQNGFYGFYSSFDNLPGKSVVEPYVLWKTVAHARGELGASGDQDVYTYGARAVGKLPRRLDYGVEMAFQTGHIARDGIRAWAGHWVAGYTLPLQDRAPRLVFEYNYASGDGNPRDGRRGTFDQLFPTNHNKYGTVDRTGWRNIHDVMPGVEWRPAAKWKWNLDFHSFWLASRQDALYTEAGAVFVINPLATSSHIGDEIDLQCAYQFSNRLQFGLGYAHLFPGAYLKQSSKGSGASYPYLMWSYRL